MSDLPPHIKSKGKDVDGIDHLQLNAPDTRKKNGIPRIHFLYFLQHHDTCGKIVVPYQMAGDSEHDPHLSKAPHLLGSCRMERDRGGFESVGEMEGSQGLTI